MSLHYGYSGGGALVAVAAATRRKAIALIGSLLLVLITCLVWIMTTLSRKEEKIT
ncbi:MAG TPA: hypothetical protein K8V20_04540 [Subdoligranulum variabile]|uniref:Uncharacterized protein n=1 Tax=Subdoligranulum variabile TaxID=214851 RepID=A0A921IKZ6_9FIRM|nr:hypothetical protein [Subdoligranulum variabile]